MKRFIKFFKRLLNRKPKIILLNNEFRIIPAFKWQGETYYMYEDPLNTATGRGLSALVFMEHLLMRCDEEYLEKHTMATEQILSHKLINITDITDIARLNRNMKERLDFLTIIPKHLYRLASVVFFTEDENPYRYDEAYNKKKIQAWSNDPDMYNFFMQKTRLRDMIPILSLPPETSQKYREIEEKVNKMHMKDLEEILFKNELMNKTMN